jgi:hypothetical protein
MNCVILQPSYIPWRGYFHQIQRADIFVFYDDVQFDKHGWRNRNQIKTPNGLHWLTIPVTSNQGSLSDTPIDKVLISWNRSWNKDHLRSLIQYYSKSPYFENYRPLLEHFFTQQPEKLADFTIEFTVALARELGISKTNFIRSSSLSITGRKTDRLLSILQHLGVTHYISGPSAKNYLEEDKITSSGISLEYMSYNYPEYPQLYPPYNPHVSILDLLFMTGPAAASYIWGSSSIPEL